MSYRNSSKVKSYWAGFQAYPERDARRYDRDCYYKSGYYDAQRLRLALFKHESVELETPE